MGKEHNLITLIFVINGKEITDDKVNIKQPLHVSVKKALGDNSRPLSDYNIIYNNLTLDVNKSVEENGLPNNATIYLSLRGGEGGNTN